MTQPTVYGYRNNHTGILVAGFHELFHDLSNPMSYDNRGRINQFGEESEYGMLDWREITNKDEWDNLCKADPDMQKPPASDPAKALRSRA
ncbi:MAG: hypothetical protein BWK73_20140 [Thiothrix lacustris]|uniref:Uncharacterized protein n=1 Tax=Thiothrix lacustris TaxID=525917 RepID=A0A1Y1QP54_9GAMM|nr:MAG: hypothetical protein BWK73_20140 [Thiothrix lacustris]